MSLQQQGHKSREEDNEFTGVSVDTLIKSITHTGNRKKNVFLCSIQDFCLACRICLVHHMFKSIITFGCRKAVKDKRPKSGCKRFYVALTNRTIPHKRTLYFQEKSGTISPKLDLFLVARKIPIYVAPGLLPAFRPF